MHALGFDHEQKRGDQAQNVYIHYGLFHFLRNLHWRRSEINRWISKSTQIIFWPILFESNRKMKFIHKKSDPPT